jgi:hypothetical protein
VVSRFETLGFERGEDVLGEPAFERRRSAVAQQGAPAKQWATGRITSF